jgi:hypothetical protein
MNTSVRECIPQTREIPPHLGSGQESAPLGTPAHGKRLAAHLEFAHADLGARVPKPYRAVRGAAGQLKFPHRVEQNFLNGMAMSPQLGLAAWTRPLGVPYADGLVVRPRGD